MHCCRSVSGHVWGTDHRSAGSQWSRENNSHQHADRVNAPYIRHSHHPRTGKCSKHPTPQLLPPPQVLGLLVLWVWHLMNFLHLLQFTFCILVPRHETKCEDSEHAWTWCTGQQHAGLEGWYGGGVGRVAADGEDGWGGGGSCHSGWQTLLWLMRWDRTGLM